MKTPTTMLLLAAAFAAVSVAPQAMAQSCDAMRSGFENWFQTQPNSRGTYWIGFNMATNRADGLYVGYSEGVGGHAALKIPLPRFSAELSLPSLSNRYLTGRSPRAPGRTPLPQFNWWCYMKCLQGGGNPDDCSFLCSGHPVPQ
jgi:hypothetical protein